MNNLLRIACALFVLTFAAGCGQSGPLFVPGDPSTVEAQPPQQQTTREDDEEDENGTATP